MHLFCELYCIKILLNFRSHYIAHEEISTKNVHLNIKKLSTRIKNKLIPKAYLARFTDNYYINRVKHPTF